MKNLRRLKPWPNGVASRPKFSTCLYLRLRGQALRALALTCDDFRSLWSRSNLHASQSKFFTVWPPNVSLYASSTCVHLRLLAVPFDQGFTCKFDLNQSERKSSQVNASARKSWPNGVASRPKFSTCSYLRLRLARA